MKTNSIYVCGTSHVTNQIALCVHNFGGNAELDVKSESHTFRIICDKNAVSLLENREQC